MVTTGKHLCVLVLLDGPSFLVFCRSDWVCLLDSCAGTNLDLCCQDREPFFFSSFFLTLLLPECSYVLTVSLFPAALQWQNTRWALTAHFAPAWQDPARLLCYWQGQRLRSVFVLRRTLDGSVQHGPTWKSQSQSRTDCDVLLWLKSDPSH